MDQDGNFFIIVNDGTAKFFKCSNCPYRSEEGSEIMEHALTCLGNDVQVINSVSSQMPSLPTTENVEIEQSFDCCLCSKKFPAKNLLVEHLDSHWPYKCTVCGGKFRHQLALRTHELRYHNPDYKAYSTDCKSCPQKFKCPRDLFRHLIACNPNRSNVQVVSTTKPQSSQESISANVKATSLVDTAKNKDSIQERQDLQIIEENQNVQNEKEEVSPSTCVRTELNTSSSHSDPNSLLEVIATDDAERTFYCDDCPIVFENLDEFKEHKEVHFPQKCKVCEKRFNTQYLLGVHELSEHSIDYNKNSTECKICSEDFEDPTTLFLHLIRSHQQAKLTYKCKQCPKSFEFRRNFNFHMKTAHKENTRQIEIVSATRANIENPCALNCGSCFVCKDFVLKLFEPILSDSSNTNSMDMSANN